MDAKFFCGGKIGNANDQVIRKYIRNQVKKRDEEEEGVKQLKLF